MITLSFNRIIIVYRLRPMRKMAATDLEFFNVGTTVSCRTCLDQEVEGEVLAFDSATRMLILKSEATSARPSLNNINMLNLSYVSDVKVKKNRENSEKLPELLSLNTARLNGRAKEMTDKKRKLVAALKAGVSPEGQRLFVAINKTLDEISWDKEDIVVMRNVRISPPYTADSVRGDTAAVNHVRKIVEKHQKEREAGGSKY